MCRTAHALLQTVICGIQMLVRVFMTVILMIENLIRMILQTLYNFISFMLQMISLVPICVVFLLTARLKCFMCGGGGPCPANRGGACDCLMSALAIVILYFIFRQTGVLDKIFFNMGYAKTVVTARKFVPTTGTITECSRDFNDTRSTRTTRSRTYKFDLRAQNDLVHYENTETGDEVEFITDDDKKGKETSNVADIIRHFNMPTDSLTDEESNETETQTMAGDLTTILYYLV